MAHTQKKQFIFPEILKVELFLFNSKLSIVLFFILHYWPWVEIYYQNSSCHFFLKSKMKKKMTMWRKKNENLSLSPEKYETAGWKMKKLRIRCKCNMASANFAKKHSAVFDQTYIAVWYNPSVKENITCPWPLYQNSWPIFWQIIHVLIWCDGYGQAQPIFGHGIILI